MKKVLAVTFGAICAINTAQAAQMDHFVEHMGIYVAATYSKPSNNGLSMGDYQVIVPAAGQNFPGDPFNRSIFLEPDFAWNYTLGASYHIPATHTRMFVDFDNFNDHDSRLASGIRELGFAPAIIGEVPSDELFTTTAYANVQERVQEWRFGLRRFVQFGPRFFMDLSGYLEYAQARREMSQHNVAPEESQFDSDRYRATNNRFRGWGPGVGMKLVGVPYAACPNWSIFAGANTTLFYGSNNFSAYEYNDETLVYDYFPESTRSVVSQFDIDFGVDYRRLLHVNGCKMRAGVTLGMRYIEMANVFKNGNTYYNPTVFSDSSNYGANLGVANDWGRFGPYLQFRVGGAHA